MEVDGETRDMVPTVVANYEQEGLDGADRASAVGAPRRTPCACRPRGSTSCTLPKTIDNDICGTDTSFGFATATEIATEAIDRVHSTAHSHHRIILTEVMGHRAGWLTLAAGVAGGADVILIPEIPYSVDKVAETIRARTARGSSFSVVAVAEGARDADDTADYEAARLLVKAAKTPEASRAAKSHLAHVEDSQREHTFRLARELEAATGLETRVTILGYVQRGGTLRAQRIGSSPPDSGPRPPTSSPRASTATWSRREATAPCRCH